MSNQPKNSPAPNVLYWDVSTTQAISAVGWPSGNTTDVYSITDVEIGEVTFAPGLTVRGFNAIEAYVSRRDANTPVFSSIDLRTAPMSLEDAYALATQWAKHFSLETTNMDNWYAERKAEAKPNTSTWIFAQPGANTPDPIISIEIHHSGNAQLPWDVTIQAYWSKNS